MPCSAHACPLLLRSSLSASESPSQRLQIDQHDFVTEPGKAQSKVRRNHLGNDVEDEIDIPRLYVTAGNMRRQAIGHRDDLNHIAKIERTLSRPLCKSLSDEPHDFRGRPRGCAVPPFRDL